MCRRVTTSNEWTQWTEKTQSRQLYTFDWGIQAAKWKHCHFTFSGPQTLNKFFVYLGKECMLKHLYGDSYVSTSLVSPTTTWCVWVLAL